MGTWASELTTEQEATKKVAWSTDLCFFLYHMESWVQMCVTYLGNAWHQDVLWEEVKSAQLQQCFGSAWKLGSCHPCGCYFDTLFTEACGFCQQDNEPWCKAEMVQKCSEEDNDKFEVLTWLPNFPDPNPFIGRAGQTSPIQGSFNLQLVGLKRFAA